MMTTLKTFLRNSPCASDKVSGFQEGKFCLFLNVSPPLITLALPLCRSLYKGNVKTCLEMENQCMTQSNISKKKIIVTINIKIRLTPKSVIKTKNKVKLW